MRPSSSGLRMTLLLRAERITFKKYDHSQTLALPSCPSIIAVKVMDSVFHIVSMLSPQVCPENIFSSTLARRTLLSALNLDHTLFQGPHSTEGWLDFWMKPARDTALARPSSTHRPSPWGRPLQSLKTSLVPSLGFRMLLTSLQILCILPWHRTAI